MSDRTLREKFSDMAVVLSIKEPGSKAFNELYIEMIQYIYNLDGFYIVLGKDYLDEARGLSIPLALKKDKFPAIYIFTDLELAKGWCKHYHYYYDEDKCPIGYAPKNQMEFLNIFQIAYQLGIYKCFVNEGDRMLCMNIADMIKVNNMDTRMMAMQIPQVEELLKQGKKPKIMVRFNCMSVVDFELTQENDEYLAKVVSDSFDEIKEAAKEYDCELICKGKTFQNASKKYLTIFFKTNDDFFNALKDHTCPKIEKIFFDAVSKHDEKNLFDNRYSYLKFETREKYPTNEDYFN
jgi:hypothetical protein